MYSITSPSGLGLKGLTLSFPPPGKGIIFSEFSISFAVFLNLSNSLGLGDLPYFFENSLISLNKFINTSDSLFDDVVSPPIIPHDRHIDFCSVDIDGLDVEVFETFEKNLPTVVCIEGGQMLHPLHPRVAPGIAQNNIQQSLATMNEIFSRKGYRVICSYQDSFFVKEEFYHLFDVSENVLNLYLDGLEALPKIPWIQKKLEEVGLSNAIVDSIAAPLSAPILEFVKRRGTKAHKMAWVDQNYDSILSTITSLREPETQ